MRTSERGFTLIELLVVFGLISTLSAITAPMLLKHREKAYAATLRADLRTAAAANEGWLTEHGGYVLPGATAVDQLGDQGYQPSRDVALTVVDDEMAVYGGGFCLRAEHALLGPARPLYWASAGPDAGRPSATACTTS